MTATASTHASGRPRAAWIALPAAVTLCTFLLRTRGTSRHFWMLGDQIRDWEIALRPLWDLPLVGPPTHVGGYTIGPAFYWILWIIRVVLGPWFDNLPHGGGIGQAALQSGADALLLVAVWTRTQSVGLALAAVLLLALAPYDLALSAVIWNPLMGSIFAKIATALVLLLWPERSLVRVGLTAAVAWIAVQCYLGAIFVALSVFAALVLPPLLKGERRAAWQRAAVVSGTVALLQVPYLAHRVWYNPADSGVETVTGSVWGVVLGLEALRLRESASAFGEALNLMQVLPWRIDAIAWVVAACGVLVLVRYWRDPTILAVTILPPAAASVGYAFWQGDLQGYYYFSLMPAAVLTGLLGATAPLGGRAAHVAGILLVIGALAIAPARLRHASTFGRMPEYGALVQASRAIVERGLPLRAIQADFLPPTSNAGFIFWILGGRLQRGAPWVAVVAPDGQVAYRPAQ